MAKRKLLDDFVGEELADDTTTENATTNSTDEFTDFMDIDSDEGVEPDDSVETDDVESLPTTSDMSWSPTDNSTTFFDKGSEFGSKTTTYDDNETNDSNLLTEESLQDVDSNTDSSSDTFFEGEAEEKGTKKLFKKLFGDDDDEYDENEDEEISNEDIIDNETDEDEPLASNLSEYYVDDTEDPNENDDSEFHMVFKKMRLNK